MFDERIHVWPYRAVGWHRDDHGYIVWRLGTGNNVELLHLKVYEPGNGHGTRLVKIMLQRLTGAPPYRTVFGFCRSCNANAQEFYRSAGFTTALVTGVYADGDACVFSGDYEYLCHKHGVEFQWPRTCSTQPTGGSG